MKNKSWIWICYEWYGFERISGMSESRLVDTNGATRGKKSPEGDREWKNETYNSIKKFYRMNSNERSESLRCRQVWEVEVLMVLTLETGGDWAWGLLLLKACLLNDSKDWRDLLSICIELLTQRWVLEVEYFLPGLWSLISSFLTLSILESDPPPWRLIVTWPDLTMFLLSNPPTRHSRKALFIEFFVCVVLVGVEACYLSPA